jgi:hypothetical protein
MSQTSDNSIASLDSRERSKHASHPSTTGAASVRSLALGLLMAGSAAGALAAGGVLSVKEEVVLASSPAKTWAAIKDFQEWQTWHPAFASTEIAKGASNANGTIRVLTTKDGAKFTEELLSHDGVRHSYQYRIIESPLPISGYVSTIEVKEGNPGSRVIWSSTFTANAGASGEEMKKAISGVYRAGLDNLQSTLK